MPRRLTCAFGLAVALAACSDPATPTNVPGGGAGAGQAGTTSGAGQATSGGGGVGTAGTSAGGTTSGSSGASQGGTSGASGAGGTTAGTGGAPSGGASGGGGASGTGGSAGTGGASGACAGAGYAVEFNGDMKTQMDSTANIATLPQGNTSRTVEMWLYTVPLSWRAEHHLYQFGDRNPREGAFGIDFGDGPYPNVQIYDNGTADTTFKVPMDTVKETGWFHFAMVWDSSTMTIRGVINGQTPSGASKKLTTTLTTPASKLSIGYSPTFSGNGGFTGKIDELRIWNVARTDAEIKSSMNQRLTGKEAGLVVYYNFDEGTGTSSKDLVGNFEAKFGGTTQPKWVTSDLTLTCP